MLLEEVDLPLERVKGLGPESLKAFASLGVLSVAGLLQHYPVRYEDRLVIQTLAQAKPEAPAAFVVSIVKHSFVRAGRDNVLKAHIADSSGEAVLVCFGRPFLAEKLEVGKKIYLYAAFQKKYNEVQAGSFDFEEYTEQPLHFGRLLPVYALAGSLTQAKARKAAERAFELAQAPLETALPARFIQERNLLADKKKALEIMHFPPSVAELERAKQTLIFEELFLFQLVTAYKRMEAQKPVRPARRYSREKLSQALFRLPFELTEGQSVSLEEVLTDLEREYPMRRLVQGDVGAGKTLVALLGACSVIQQGRQAALMAPTELLARQHADSAAALLGPLGIRTAFLTGNLRASGRRQLLDRLAAGEIDLIVGTHALFSAEVQYKDLALAIVDEQHRFGVMQRLKLLQKGSAADLLLMSATPIPRTLALSAYGDLDLSTIKSLPAGRLPIKTHLADAKNEDKVYRFVQSQLEAGSQAYFVYPLIEQSEKIDLKNVEAMFERLKTEIFPNWRIGLIHSRLDEEEKRKTMDLFAKGGLDILAATSAVEVGIDVRNATVMVIEGAERFGLAALHQLRGRVGRGAKQSYCFLVYNPPLSEEGKARLKALYESCDGFAIAEKDLQLRGPGQLGGVKQSGAAKFRLADLQRDIAMLAVTAQEAAAVLQEDAHLERHKNLKTYIRLARLKGG